MKILVLGCKGQLGQCLNDQLLNTVYDVVYTSRDQINIVDFVATKNQILGYSPDVVINATAYTAVDKAEDDQEMANIINHLAVENIAAICDELGCWLVHVSTDYVFDGMSKFSYREDDHPNPQGVYGVTKLNGELAVKSFCSKYIIIRTAWVFSEYGDNFLKTMLRLSDEHDELRVVSDQIGCPTYAQDIANAIVRVIPVLMTGHASGTYHYAGSKPCSWAGFAEAIFTEAVALNFMARSPKVTMITSDEFPTRAKRPTNSMLDSSLFEKSFGGGLSDWQDGVRSAVFALKAKSQ